MATRKPASVLPDPVGAAIRVSWPDAMSGQPWDCGAVGPSGNRRRNHSATAGWKSTAPWPLARSGDSSRTAGVDRSADWTTL